ncbi:hypothetical protein [Cognatishimia activa]|uniref:hypothetical protein n=1 Tax=Cognatishimia activa TaxID=1715691 RepID=UPI00223247E1|nr:hypothetical protein [Cognatishimia activa]UZD90726.1 hypothetical protein M0D42_14215 [Cognatishimia activa]
MIASDDLRAAVESGLLTEAQAVSLRALADSRRGAREGLAPGDEPFELFKGFNEIFIVVGLVILAAGWITVNSVTMATEIVNYQSHILTATVIGGLVIWGISEYFIRIRRMVAPAIALSIMFAGNAVAGCAAYFAEPFMVAQEDFSSLPIAMGASVAALTVYWWRFRVPFAMALIALGIFGLAMIIGANSAGTPADITDIFRLSAQGPFAWITLAVGLAVFVVAMVFDMSDPHRVTRRSAQGFWLHVVAAPALVNTLALALMESESNAVLLVVLLAFALIAIIIDRRSFLITAIGYVVALAFTVFEGDGAGLTILFLGIFLVALGAFWARIRAALLKTFSGVLPLKRLPPAHS